MTFQIFVGGQRVNSADVLNTPTWSPQVSLLPSVTSRTSRTIPVPRRLFLSFMMTAIALVSLFFC